MTGKANLAASVGTRLLNRARQTGDDYQTLLTSHCLERFLYRLGVSDRRHRCVLKGAMLLRLWSDRPYRATIDLDFLRPGDGAFDAIREDLRAIVATPVPPDAVSFDGERIRRPPQGASHRAHLCCRDGQDRRAAGDGVNCGGEAGVAPPGARAGGWRAAAPEQRAS